MPIDVQCVYGNEHVPHLERVLIPSLVRASTQGVTFYCINYDGRSGHCVRQCQVGHVDVVPLPNTTGRTCGFAESHNLLFAKRPRSGFFVMVNPDCIAQKGSLDVLAARFRAIGASAGLVEGRQWPFEHPKEYDPESGRTPWASGAFVLVNDTFYERVGGMDEAYFLYTEDVDLSWQAWLNDFEVVYEPRAAVIHFSGGAFYRSDLVSREEFYSLRNFIGINSKFFGPHGEESARTLAQRFGDPALVRQAIRSYEQELKPRLKLRADGAVHHPMIKVLGLNQFHEIRAQ